METGLQHLCPLAPAWRAECAAGTAAPASARQGGQAGQARRGHHRLPIGQDRLKRGQCGYDAGKRVKGRKRHTVVDRSYWCSTLPPRALRPASTCRCGTRQAHSFTRASGCAPLSCCGGWRGAEPESKTRAILRGEKMAFSPFPLGPDALITRAEIRHPSTPELLGRAWLGQKERRRAGLRSS